MQRKGYEVKFYLPSGQDKNFYEIIRGLTPHNSEYKFC
jgi:hypothetical protein